MVARNSNDRVHVAGDCDSLAEISSGELWLFLFESQFATNAKHLGPMGAFFRVDAKRLFDRYDPVANGTFEVLR